MTGKGQAVLWFAAVAMAAAAPSASLPASRSVALGDGVRMEFVLVSAGRFLMGSTSDEGDGDEKPQHAVAITTPYYMGTYEVTQAQWQAVMQSNPSQFSGAELPVDSVSWDDCREFVRRASRLAGVALALPTEAQWEYACRAGTTTRWSHGNNEDAVTAYAWLDADARGTTHSVGKKKPNRWGLYDMTGNVAEWCADWYGTPYPAAAAVDPTGPTSGTTRVLRGGNWSDNPGGARPASRNCNAPDGRTAGSGLRCVLIIEGRPIQP